MRHRLQIALIFLAPAVLLGALYLLGLTIPVPALGRDYVIRVVLPDSTHYVGSFVQRGDYFTDVRTGAYVTVTVDEIPEEDAP